MRNILRGGLFISILILGGALAAVRAGQYDQAKAQPPKNIFHVKYISENSVYLDAGKNAGLEEGMILHIVPPDPDGGTTESVRFRGGAPLEPGGDALVRGVVDDHGLEIGLAVREDGKQPALCVR